MFRTNFFFPSYSSYNPIHFNSVMHSKYPENNTELFHYKHFNCVKSHPPPLFSLSAPPLFFFNIWFMYIARLNAIKFTVTCIPVSSQDDIFFLKES